jgi:DNA-binding IclR family transcriptional regulator
VAHVGDHGPRPDAALIVIGEDVVVPVTDWSFLTNHARVLVCVAHDPGIRLRDIASAVGITERTAHGIVTDLANAGYLLKERDGRRNRYQIQHHLPLPDATASRRTIGEVLDLLVETDTSR